MITKEQWSEIEKELQGLFACRKFKLGGDEISVARELIEEGGSELVVYFNGAIIGCWTHESEDKNYQSLIEKFWRRRSVPNYNRKQKAAPTRIYGKRQVQKEVPDIDAEYIYYLPSWPKARTLVGQLKKIPGLELVQ